MSRLVIVVPATTLNATEVLHLRPAPYGKLRPGDSRLATVYTPLKRTYYFTGALAPILEYSHCVTCCSWFTFALTKDGA